jgi:DNA polymerase-3 subunit alpha
VALYRPGPMEFIPEYIRRKYNPSLITFPDPRTEPYLKGSLGLLIYQDDIMQLAVDLAGYTWLEADMFRKAMGKKIPELMAEQEIKFKEGLKKSGLQDKTITEMWENIVTFAAYGFNKGHAAAYGKLSYMTAYMKANYPAEYMAAVLTADSGDNERIARAVEECKNMKIPVLPPDVNESFEDFGVVVADKENENDIDKIRFGLRTIKNFGDHISEVVVNERKANGPYKNLEDFLNRIKDKDLNKKSIEALTLSGALDSLEDRNAILANVDEILKFTRDEREKNQNQDSLFSMMDDSGMSALKLENPKGKKISIKTGMNDQLHYTLPMNKKDQLFWEKELLGLYVSGHPLDKYRNILEKDGKNIESIKAKGYKGNNTIAGVIDELKIITTKKGQRMAFVKISDFTGSIETVFFPEAFKENEEFLTAENILAVSGKLNDRDNDGNLTLLVDKVKILR